MGIGNILGGAAAGATISIVIKAVDQYSKNFNKLDKDMAQQQSGFKRLGSAVKGMGIGYAALAGAAIGFGTAAVKQALKAETAMQSFNLILGDTADTMLEEMRNASRGMISDFELVSNANAALALGIQKDDIPGLLQVAAARSKMFGRTASEAFNDLAIGIGRQSRMILDNLGIILDLDKVYGEYATTLGITADEVRNLYAKEALSNAIIKESTGIIAAQNFMLETHEEKIQRVTASWENLKEKLGNVILKYVDYVSGQTAVNEAMERSFDEAVDVVGAYKEVQDQMSELDSVQKDLSSQIEAANTLIKDQVNLLLDLKDVTFSGERAKSLEIAQQKEVIRQLELREAKGYDIEELLEKEENNLKIMRLESDLYENKREIQAAKNAVDLENKGELEVTNFRAFRYQQEERFKLIDDERKRLGEAGKGGLLNDYAKISESYSNAGIAFGFIQDVKEEGYDEEEKSIDKIIEKTNDLIRNYGRAASARDELTSKEKLSSRLGGIGQYLIPGYGGAKLAYDVFGKTTSVGDAIIRPNGEVIETHPNDTLIATQNPGEMGGATIYIGNINGLTGKDIANSLQTELRGVIRI